MTTTVALARNAMATRFELVLTGENQVRLRAAGEAALAEAERLESHLSLYKPASVISLLNARAGLEWVRVDAEVFHLLEAARNLSIETGGAFDITVAPLVRCWGFMRGSGAMPSPEAIAECREKVGPALVELNPEQFSVRFSRQGVMLDLGAIGKGYAIDRMIEILIEGGVDSALVHGGTSTVYGLGRGPEGRPWNIAVDRPRHDCPTEGKGLPLAVLILDGQSLSVSACSGKFFVHQGKRYGHVIDPRTGFPTDGAELAAVVLPSCLETDALSTALLTLGREGLGLIKRIRPEAKALVAWEESGALQVESSGIELCRGGD